MSKKILVLFLLCALPGLATAQFHWQKTESMNSPRFVFRMIALNSQKALAAGGQDLGLTALSTSEIYDPATETWTATGPLNIARANYRLVKLSDGSILAIGGQTGEGNPVVQTSSIERFDESTGAWSIVGQLQEPLQNFALAYVDDSHIYILGGLVGDNVTKHCEVYNAVTNESSFIASLTEVRHNQPCLPLHNGKILVTGGRNGGAGSVYLSSCEIYDPALNAWTPLSPMSQNRMEGVLVEFSDDVVLAAGGRNDPRSSATGSETLDQSSLTWDATAPMLEPCVVSANVPLPEDRFLMTGGQVDGDWYSGTENVTTPNCEWYERTDRTWYFAPTLNVTRDKHEAVYLKQTTNPNLPEELVLVAGGLVGQQDTIMGSIMIHPYITPTAEVMNVTAPQLQYYAQHQPLSGVRDQMVPNSSLTYDGGSLRLHAESSGLAIIQYTDVAGRVVANYTIQHSAGATELPLPAAHNQFLTVEVIEDGSILHTKIVR